MTTHTTATLPWAARSMPRLRTERVRDVEAQAARLEDLERLRWRAGVAPVPAGRTTAADTTAQASALADAELFWVTGDMARLALDASTDVPDWDAGQLIALRGMCCSLSSWLSLKALGMEPQAGFPARKILSDMRRRNERH